MDQVKKLNEMMKDVAQKMERLRSLSDEHRRDVISDPLKYLERAHEQLYLACRCFAAIERALSPEYVFAYKEDMSIRLQARPESIVGESIQQLGKIEKILRAYNSGADPYDEQL